MHVICLRNLSLYLLRLFPSRLQLTILAWQSIDVLPFLHMVLTEVVFHKSLGLILGCVSPYIRL